MIGAMNTTSLATALSVLRDTVTNHPRSLHGSLRREIGALCTELFTALAGDLSQVQDPRLVLQTAQLVEDQFRATVRAQLAVTAAAEATGAHTLATEEYNRLRAGTTVWEQPPEHTSGRTNHRTTAALLSGWLGIDEHEAAARVEDTHRVIGRRTIAGTPAGPRFAGLSALFLDPARDPRTARNAARRIEKFEPADQIAEGTPLPPAATGPDGVLLEDHVVRLLSTLDGPTAGKRLSALCTAYKEANTKAIKPTEYFRRLRTVMGVDIYQLAVAGENAEVLRSITAQLDNPNTKAGKAARALGDLLDPADPDAGNDTAAATPDSHDSPTDAETDADADEPIAPWLTTDEPPPDWAVDPDEATDSDQAIGPDQTTDSDQGNPAPQHPQEPETAEEGTAEPGRGPSAAQRTAGPTVRERLAQSTADSAHRVEVEQRRLNGFMNLLKQRLTGKGNSTQVVPTINIYMHLAQLQKLAKAHGITTHGIRLSPTELRRALCKAKVMSYIFDGDGQILDAGRAKRFFDGPIRLSLLARDRGCIVPGCTHPPELCEGHHWPEGGWLGGCGTSVHEGCLLCPRHHTDVHAGKFQIILYRGLPHVVLPAYLDPTQTPRRNGYWLGEGESLRAPAGQLALDFDIGPASQGIQPPPASASGPGAQPEPGSRGSRRRPDNGTGGPALEDTG